MIIHLIRHGESEANIGAADPAQVGDHTIALTARGQDQARATGARLGADVLRTSLLFVSPYRRTRMTMAGVLAGVGVAADQVRIFEDPRLREVDHGYEPSEDQQPQRAIHGWFYYRYKGGESPADCYDRCCTFLSDLHQQMARKNNDRVVIVSHSLTIRCFVMRFLHLSVEQFDAMDSLPNAGVVTIQARDTAPDPVFVTGRWGVWGLTVRS